MVTQAVINLAIMLAPVWIMLVAVIVEDLL
jgi:hypothetical protein